jgi:hypothetical protein
MKTIEKKYPESFNAMLIAPCGINCATCMGYLREKKPCQGCNGEDAHKPQHCITCRIKYCPEMGGSEQKFCFECTKFPCTRMRQLDKRYRTKYHTSLIENLQSIQTLGIEEFVIREKDRWKCPQCGGTICVHRESCIYCGWAKG